MPHFERLMAQKTRIHAIFPNYCSGAWVSYTLMSVLDNMRDADTDTHAYVLGKSRAISGSRATRLLPDLMYGRTSRLLSDPCDSIVRRFAHKFKRGDIAYFWLTSPTAAVRRLQARGMFVAREMINCTWLRRRREHHMRLLAGQRRKCCPNIFHKV